MSYTDRYSISGALDDFDPQDTLDGLTIKDGVYLR